METHFLPKLRWSPKKKKKRKKVFAKIEADFLAKIVRFRLVGGMHPEIETDFSKRRLIFWPKSLVLGWWGGMHPPPKSATARKCCLLYRKQCNLSIFMPLQQSVCRPYLSKTAEQNQTTCSQIYPILLFFTETLTFCPLVQIFRLD